jgi:hypothetical protein
MVFAVFCLLVDEIIKLKVFPCSFELLIYLEILSVTLLKDPCGVTLTLKMHRGSRL